MKSSLARSYRLFCLVSNVDLDRGRGRSKRLGLHGMVNGGFPGKPRRVNQTKTGRLSNLGASSGQLGCRRRNFLKLGVLRLDFICYGPRLSAHATRTWGAEIRSPAIPRGNKPTCPATALSCPAIHKASPSVAYRRSSFRTVGLRAESFCSSTHFSGIH
jgi:hypothetical protein